MTVQELIDILDDKIAWNVRRAMATEIKIDGCCGGQCERPIKAVVYAGENGDYILLEGG